VLLASIGDFATWPNVVVHTTIDFRREIVLGTREVVVRTRIVDVGRSSVRFEHTVHADDGEPAAEVTAVLAAWDPQTRRSRPITPAERDALTDWGVSQL
jgi:acyl-CoA thioester hydrolase